MHFYNKKISYRNIEAEIVDLQIKLLTDSSQWIQIKTREESKNTMIFLRIVRMNMFILSGNYCLCSASSGLQLTVGDKRKKFSRMDQMKVTDV